MKRHGKLDGPGARAAPRALLAWEYGAGLGHMRGMEIIGQELKSRGYYVILAYPDNAGINHDAVRQNTHFDEVVPVADVRQLTVPFRRPTPRRTYADVLERMGFGSAKFLYARIKVWQTILAQAAPHIIVADFAPCLLMAARHRVPTIAFGNAYTLPPTGIATYAPFQNVPLVSNPGAMLESVHKAAGLAGCYQPENLPEVFAADAQFCATLPQMDPFASQRSQNVFPPLFDMALDVGQGPIGDTIFAYFTDCAADVLTKVLRGLIGFGGKTQVYGTLATDDHHKLCRNTCVDLLQATLPMADILRKSRFAVSFGSFGTVNAMLLTGIPQLIVSTDVEKSLYARELKRHGLVASVQNKAELSEADIGNVMQAATDDSALAERTLAFARSLPKDICDQGRVALGDLADTLI